MSIELVEVSARDGLQNEKQILSTVDKLDLINQIIGNGTKRIEVASFVNPKLVPQMGDAEAVIDGLADNKDLTFIGLVLNKRGALRAIDTKIDQLGIVCVATDTFGQKNQGMTSEESVQMAAEVAKLGLGAGKSVQATIAVSFGCPFEGKTDPQHVLKMVEHLAKIGVCEIALADTIGIGTPFQIYDLVSRAKEIVKDLPIRVHFHDTRGMGVANAVMATKAGATIIDSSISGTGGCPFAPGATGNVATEDIKFAFGDKINIDFDKIISTAKWINQKLNRTNLSALLKNNMN